MPRRKKEHDLFSSRHILHLWLLEQCDKDRTSESQDFRIRDTDADHLREQGMRDFLGRVKNIVRFLLSVFPELDTLDAVAEAFALEIHLLKRHS